MGTDHQSLPLNDQWNGVELGRLPCPALVTLEQKSMIDTRMDDIFAPAQYILSRLSLR